MSERKKDITSEISRPFSIGISLIPGKDRILVDRSMILSCTLPKAGQSYLEIHSDLIFPSKEEVHKLTQAQKENEIYINNPSDEMEKAKRDLKNTYRLFFEGDNNFMKDYTNYHDMPLFYFQLFSCHPINLQVISKQVPVLSGTTTRYKLPNDK